MAAYKQNIYVYIENINTVSQQCVCQSKITRFICVTLTCTIPGSAATFPICFMAGRNPPTPARQSHSFVSSHLQFFQNIVSNVINICIPIKRKLYDVTITCAYINI